ncbi:MAG: OmpA family protein [bacterium]
MSLRILGGVLVAIGAAAPAAAQIRPGSIELGASGGIWEGDEFHDDAPVFGVRAGFNFTRVFGLELRYSGVSTTAHVPGADGLTTTEEDRFISQLGLGAVLNLNDAVVNPYLSAGAGMVLVEETYFGANVGLGVRWHITDMFITQADVRGWFSPDAPANDEYAHFQATLGFGVQIGGDFDMDKDGVENTADGCPTQAEDKDGFEDTDGCPDDDNDKDEIKDADDKCPNEAEDKDGDRDEDGCPDVDDDGDGVDNKTDKCIDKAEDKDGFEDEDGCPDLDNDQDGIPDLVDQCPDIAEDFNGYEDEDGCPEADRDRDRDGILDSVDRCPDDPEDKDGFEDEDGCPELDNDRDGVPDSEDQCPMEPEDIDGFKDEDGCPDPDNDQDGIPDDQDQCPNQPENFNGVEDGDGCPEVEKKVVIAGGKIRILDKVFFETNKAVIKTESYDILFQVAETLRQNPGITKVEIQGHTDSRGRDDYNLELSDRRAAAVRDFLIERGGIKGERLVSKGYGETEPIINEENADAWAQNRRVEFVILEEKATEPGPFDQ